MKRDFNMSTNKDNCVVSEQLKTIDSWIESHWDEFLTDLKTLVSINSVEDKSSAKEGAPWGEGPAKALNCAIDIARKLGFETKNIDGAVGYADVKCEGKVDKKQIALIGHTDVVPAGEGWNTVPFSLTKREGFLLGRGVIDDKGPLLCGLYALAYCAQTMQEIPYGLRAILGANEETGMGDLEVYQKYCDDPDFLFSPDANWPLVYGEKGIWQAEITSKKIERGNLLELNGGSAPNAVPGFAHAKVKVSDIDLNSLKETEGITASVDGDVLIVEATGKGAHASTPEEGISAINKLVHYLLKNNLLLKSEIPFVDLVARLSDSWDGSSVCVQCEDDAFGKLTLVAGVISLYKGVLTQTIDVRFPTTINADELETKISKLAGEADSSLEVTNCMLPFLMDSQSVEIDALMSAYKEVTGDAREPFTIGGGTYARHFKNAVSFGVEKTWEKYPSWVGGMHGPNEGVKESDLKEAIKIYIRAIQNLCKVEL